VSERKSKAEMFGEVLREIGVLVVVFFPFDEWITFHALSWKFALGSVVLSAALRAAGMWVEATRWR
jgi:hypothetical protein